MVSTARTKARAKAPAKEKERAKEKAKQQQQHVRTSAQVMDAWFLRTISVKW